MEGLFLKNGILTKYNPLDEIEDPQVTYDLDGNLRQFNDWRYSYDSLGRLVKASEGAREIRLAYDALGLCRSKTIDGQQEYYLYQGDEEFGSFTPEGTTKTLKVPGLQGKPVALEIDDKLYVPFFDSQGNIRRLVDVETGQLAESFEYSVFGEEALPEKKICPWRYLGKRYHQIGRAHV